MQHTNRELTDEINSTLRYTNHLQYSMNILNTFTKIAIFVIILLLIGLMGYAIFNKSGSKKISPLVGKPAPVFNLELYGGGTINLEEFHGKPVLINFWASWCIPCRDEAPALESAWSKYKDKGIHFVGVNIWDDNENALAYLSKYGSQYPQGKDPNDQVQLDYGVGGVPETYFVNSEGMITDKFTGPLKVEYIDYFMDRALNNTNHSK